MLTEIEPGVGGTELLPLILSGVWAAAVCGSHPGPVPTVAMGAGPGLRGLVNSLVATAVP